MVSGNKNPFFSIICPCYNQAEFLMAAIHSVQSQEFGQWELILVNDGSTDDSAEIAENFERTDPRIRVIHQANQGLSNARNAGSAVAIGQYLGFLDADDIYLAGAFHAVFSQISRSDADLIIGGYRYFKENDFFHTQKFSRNELSPAVLLWANQAPPVAHFIKHSVAKSIGDFDLKLKSCEDWEFWIRVAKMGFKIITISEVIAGYRYVPNSMSRKPKVMYEALSEVSRRAFINNSALLSSFHDNSQTSIDLKEIQKKHLIRCLGVSIHQGKAKEAATWFREEVPRWNWDIQDEDWLGLSSQLSWRYFLEKGEIEEIFTRVLPDLELFFLELGYSSDQINKLTRSVLRPQRFRSNHLRFGKWMGAAFNRFLD
jgi:GT2 family glycosyltransferase